MTVSNFNNREIDKMSVPFITYASDILGDTEKGLSGTQIVKYSSLYAVEYHVDIPYGIYPFLEGTPNKRTALNYNLQAFNGYQQYEIINHLCDLPLFSDNEEVKKLKIKLINEYSKFSINKENGLNNRELIIKTKHWLGMYPKSLKLYEEALTQYNNNIFQRNTLDNMRLSFEILLKDVLNNNKSLENNFGEIGKYLKTKNFSNELRNMLVKLVEYYSKYQNEYIKHDDNVNKNEIEFIIELTSIMMKLII